MYDSIYNNNQIFFILILGVNGMRIAIENTVPEQFSRPDITKKCISLCSLVYSLNVYSARMRFHLA